MPGQTVGPDSDGGWRFDCHGGCGTRGRRWPSEALALTRAGQHQREHDEGVLMPPARDVLAGNPDPDPDPDPGPGGPPPDGYNGYGAFPAWYPEWFAEPDALVSSWAEAETAYDAGARIIHLRGGEYGAHDWNTRPGVFIRNEPGQHVRVTGDQNIRAPGVTFAGLHKAGGWGSVRGDGDGSGFYRIFMSGITGFGVNGTGSSYWPLNANFIELHSIHVGWLYSGEPNDWTYGSNIMTMNHGGRGYIDGCWLSGRTAAKGLIQNINFAHGSTMKNTWLGRGSSGHFSTHDQTRVTHIENCYYDWWPHPVGGASGWQMRVDDPNMESLTVKNTIAQRPRLDNNNPTTRPQELWVHKLAFDGVWLYSIPQINRAGDLLVSNAGAPNTTLNALFPGDPPNAFRQTMPEYTLPWTPPVWLHELGLPFTPQATYPTRTDTPADDDT